MPSERPSARPARVSRRDLAEAPLIWLMHGITLLLVSGATAGLALLVPEYSQRAMFAFSAALLVFAIWILGTKPPAMGTLPSHVSLASVYAFIGFGELAMRPDWMVPLAAGGFAGTLISTRVEARRDIAAHLVAATLCLGAPAVVVGATAVESLGVFVTIATVWALCGCCVVLFDALERQGRELEQRLRLDPLTGIGNQRLLSERLATELQEHARLRRPMSVLALDLTDFTELNEELGRSGGDDVLSRAARAIASAIGSEATLTRPIDDEFWVLLPGTDALEAQDATERIRTALATVATGDPTIPRLAAAFGVASYPRDAVQADRLLDLAHERMATDRQLTPMPAHDAAVATAITSAAPTPTPLPADANIRGLSRRDLARSRSLWGFAGVIYALGIITTAVGTALSPDPQLVRSAIVACLLAASAGLVLVPRPPATDELRNHLFLASLAICAGAAFLLLPAGSGVAVVASIFVAPVIAVRTNRRRQTFVHLAFASGVLAVVLAVGLITGDLARATLFEVALLVASVWSLGISCMAALEISDAQGLELEELVRTDQVTGLGNRLMMDEVLGREIERHRTQGAPLSVLVLELVETFENSRGATEQLLSGAAEALQQAVGPDDTVVRRRGHEFVLILPNAAAPQIDHAASAVFASLSGLDGQGHRIECLHAAASFPDDGDDAATVLAVADARLMNAGAPIGFRRHLGSA